MKREQIEEGIKSLFSKRTCGAPDFEFRFKDSEFVVEMSKMYETVKITFADMKAISELCGTDKIDLHDGHHREGCETCDYGSSYSVVVSVRGVKIEE